ncbi:hypothetical protein BJ165DRAFT_1535052 [Panaeolus papilionaceus]|nr:hypothetical protein BJ165DRAFT_1535052 [Panaeolus papilionaceus]
MSILMDLDDDIVDWNPSSLSDPASEASDSDSDSGSGSGSESGSDESEETSGDEGGEVEVRAQDEMEGDFDRLVKNIRQRDTFNSSASTSGAGSNPLTGILTKEWDLTIEEQEAQFKDDLREASGVGRKRRKKGRHPGPILSHQVKSLIGDGNQAYVDNNPHEAIRIMHEVIRIEPRAFAAWSVLASCYSDMGEQERALQLRIMGAHLQGDSEEWTGLARMSREMGFLNQALYCFRKAYSVDPTNVDALWDRAALAREMGDWRTAKGAYLAILKRVPHDLTVLRELHTILVELSEYELCATLLQDALDSYMKRYPGGLAASSGVSASSSGSSSSGAGPSTSSGPGPSTSAPAPGRDTAPAQDPHQPPLPLLLLLLADLYNVLGQHVRAIETIKRGTRWVQGRAGERWWEGVEDDREYDVVGVSRGDIGGKEGGTGEGGEGGERGRVGEGLGERGPGEVKPGYHPLDCNARHRLAVARIKMGDEEEGKYHASIILSSDVLDYSVLFLEIADAYFEKEMYEDAKVIYELLGGDVATSSVYVLLQTAACMKNIGELRDAADVYEHVCLADPTNNDAKMKLAEIYEILGETRKALKLVYEVIDSRKKRKAGPAGPSSTPTLSTTEDPTTTSLFAEDKSLNAPKAKLGAGAKPRLTPAQLRALEAEKEREVVRGWRRCCEVWEGMLRDVDGEGEGGADNGNEREWMMEAEKLVDMFRETRNLFLTSRSNPFAGMFPRSRMRRRVETEADEDRMADRLQLDIEQDSLARRNTKSAGVTVFRGVSFDDWLRLFMQYCFILTKRGQYDVAEEILRHIMVSNAYQPQDRQNSIRIALITCSILAERPDVVVEQARKLITTHQFNNEPLRILLASLASGLKLTDNFITSTLQKHLFREMKLSDTAVKNPGILRWNGLNRRYAATATSGAAGKKKNEDGDEEEEDDETPAPTGGATATATANVDGAPRIPTKGNPVIVAIYGQICVAAKSYQSAIFYLLHAYDYYPNDPMICLCLAIASIGRAMQRQSDNRHHLVVQAMAFLTKYRKLRGTTTAEVREVEYNFGRTFHQLGLYSHAVKHYEKVLELAEQAGDDLFAREAAFNLSCIFVFTGAVPLADALYRKWLSL